MASDLACNRLFKLVREFSQRTPSWSSDCVAYQTLPDERYDLTLVSKRVYGARSEFLTVQAAAGLDSPECALTERLLILPNFTILAQLKAQAGYG